jgi:hypothetical protein
MSLGDGVKGSFPAAMKKMLLMRSIIGNIFFALKRKLGIDQKLVLGYSLLVAENVFLKENYNEQKCHISQNVRTVLLLYR